MSEFINPPLLVGIGVALIFYFGGWITILLMGLVVCVGLGAIYWNQGKLLYIPEIPGLPRSPAQNSPKLRHPTQHELDTIDLKLNTSDGIKICGWHVKNPKSRRVIIYLHENAGNIGARIYFLKYLSQSTESDVVLVAYRGYSDSEGTPSEPGLKKDAEAIVSYAIDYCANNDKKLVLFGSSLGGAVATYIASSPQFHDKIDGLILQNTFTSIGDMIDSLMPVLSYVKWLQTNHWRSIDVIGSVKAPILFVKSARDELVPPNHMHTLMNNANSSLFVEEFSIPTGTHNSHWDQDPQNYFKHISSFLSKIQPR